MKAPTDRLVALKKALVTRTRKLEQAEEALQISVDATMAAEIRRDEAQEEVADLQGRIDEE